MKDRIWKWEVQSPGSRADTTLLEAFEKAQGCWESPAEPSKAPVGPTTLTRSQLKKMMESGAVLANGVPLKPSGKLASGMLVEMRFQPPEPDTLTPEDRPLEILYEDEHLLVVNKPPGLTVHPSSTQKTGTLVHALLHHVRDLSGIGGVLRPGIVHRIDKDTSGALVITKTDQAHQGLSEIFAKHEIERVYWALCYGSPAGALKGKPIKIESLIGRHPVDRQKMSMKVKKGRRAVTYYRKLEEYQMKEKRPFGSWLELTLETGRTHQIRVHLTGLGYSLLGDPVYGTPTQNQPKWQALPDAVKQAVRNLPGQALHARVLGFRHPVTGKVLSFEANPPEGFREVLKQMQQCLTA